MLVRKKCADPGDPLLLTPVMDSLLKRMTEKCHYLWHPNYFPIASGYKFLGQTTTKHLLQNFALMLERMRNFLTLSLFTTTTRLLKSWFYISTYTYKTIRFEEFMRHLSVIWLLRCLVIFLHSWEHDKNFQFCILAKYLSIMYYNDRNNMWCHYR